MGDEERYEKGKTRDRVRDTFKKEVFEHLRDTNQSITEIKKALVGDEFGNKGLINKVKENESYIDKDKKAKWMISGGVVLIGLMLKFGHKIKDLF